MTKIRPGHQERQSSTLRRSNSSIIRRVGWSCLAFWELCRWQGGGKELTGYSHLIAKPGKNLSKVYKSHQKCQTNLIKINLLKLPSPSLHCLSQVLRSPNAFRSCGMHVATFHKPKTKHRRTAERCLSQVFLGFNGARWPWLPGCEGSSPMKVTCFTIEGPFQDTTTLRNQSWSFIVSFFLPNAVSRLPIRGTPSFTKNQLRRFFSKHLSLNSFSIGFCPRKELSS